MKKQIFTFLFLVTTNVYAEYTSLTCEDPKDKWTLVVQFDERTQKVKVNHQEFNALIDDNQIIWEDRENDSGLTINRTNGDLSIFSFTSKRTIGHLICSKSKKKF